MIVDTMPYIVVSHYRKHYVLQMNGREQVCAHSRSKILIENNSIWHIKHFINYIIVTLIGCMI